MEKVEKDKVERVWQNEEVTGTRFAHWAKRSLSSSTSVETAKNPQAAKKRKESQTRAKVKCAVDLRASKFQGMGREGFGRRVGFGLSTSTYGPLSCFP